MQVRARRRAKTQTNEPGVRGGPGARREESGQQQRGGEGGGERRGEGGGQQRGEGGGERRGKTEEDEGV